MPKAVRADVMTFGPDNFAEYLAQYRAKAETLTTPSATNPEVLALVQREYIATHGSAVQYQYLGDDGAGPPVFRLGTAIVTQDVLTQLNALVADGSIRRVPGADNAFSCNPHLRR